MFHTNIGLYTGFVNRVTTLVLAVAQIWSIWVLRSSVGPPKAASAGSFSQRARDGCHGASGDGEEGVDAPGMATWARDRSAYDQPIRVLRTPKSSVGWRRFLVQSDSDRGLQRSGAKSQDSGNLERVGYSSND